MWRYGMAVLVSIVLSGPAEAQSWFPWANENSSWSPPARRQGSPYGGTGFSFWSQEYERPPGAFPQLMAGGPRPSIRPMAPPVVSFRSGYESGTIVIDTSGRALYYVIGPGRAYRYPISVGREGFTWRGTEKISRIADWPDWYPPAEMRERDPRLPEKMTGGMNNPLGAKAIYLGNSLYRIHGTNDARTIGYAASSGCFRMMNHHVIHLAGLVHIGSPVHVVSRLPGSVAGDEDDDEVPVRRFPGARWSG
jgi:lipoprotein-anchoring transpeptidase ErfK/SrfK